MFIFQRGMVVPLLVFLKQTGKLWLPTQIKEQGQENTIQAKKSVLYCQKSGQVGRFI